MDVLAQLTRREYEIAELLAWGASKKEVAEHLFISVRTVENHTRNIFEKLGCNSVNELSALWFCNTYHISMSLSPRKCKLMAILMFVLIAPQLIHIDNDIVRVFRNKTAAKTCRMSRRKSESEDATFDFAM